MSQIFTLKRSARLCQRAIDISYALLVGGVCLGYAVRASAGCAAPATLEAAVTKQPSAAAFWELGTWFAEHGQAVCAIQPLLQSTKLDASSLPSHLSLAAALDSAKRPTEAETQWRAALSLDPHSQPALTGLTRNLLSKKDYSSLIGLLGSGRTLDPELSVDLALAYGQTGMLDEAAKILRKGMAANPTSLPLSEALAGVLVMQSRKQEAEDLLEASVKQNPGDLGVKLLYMRMLVMEDETESAGALGRDLLAMDPNHWEVQYLNGLMERRAGEFIAARAHLERAVALNPENAEAQQDLGSVLAKLKDQAGAKQHLERAIELGNRSGVGLEGSEAHDPEVHFELSAVLRSLGESADADRELKLYQQQAQSKSDLTQAAAKAAFADQKLAAGDTAEAIPLYRDALVAAPNEASIAYRLAMALDKAGDTTGERAALEQTLKINPHMSEAQNQLGYLASRAGDAVRAEEHFRLAVTADPAYVKAWINLAATLLLESKSAESQGAIDHALQLDPNNPQAQKLKQALIAMHLHQ